MHFRELGNGGYFPPIIPNGRFMAMPGHGRPMQELFEVRDEGLFTGGVFLLWKDITGIVLDGQLCRIASDKYRSGGLGFLLGGCEHRTSQGRIAVMQGYPVEYCLMNRVTFEIQQLDMESVL
ncbi:hypothetical protein [Geopseudomonas aromaticivorans]